MTNIFEKMTVASAVAVDERDAYAPLRKLIERSEGFDALKKDYIAKPATLSASGYDVVIDGQAFRPNKNGMSQLAQKLANLTNDEEAKSAKLPAFWMMKGNGAKAHECEYILNSRFQDAAAANKPFMYRTWNGSLRATLASTYPTFGGEAGFENTTMLKATLTTFEQLKAKEAKIARCSITPDSIRARVFFNDVNAGDMGGKMHSMYAGALWLGAIISNDETGNGGFKVGPAIMRTTCNNSFHHADADAGYFELTHTGNVLRFQRALREAMEACVEGSLELVERLIEAEKVNVDFDALTKRAIEKFGWEQKVKDAQTGKSTRAIPEKYQGVLINLKTWANDTAQMDSTLAGFVNAITRAAHNQNAQGEYTFTEDEQYEMEAYATDMLYRF